MGTRQLRKLRIGYWPLSQNLNSPGDRRRLIFWARARGHSVTTDLNEDVDVIVATENSDFNSKHFIQQRSPIVFDLIDAYLSPLNPIDDLARGFAKKLTGQLTGRVKPFSHHIREFCLNANAVICSSPEQAEVIRQFNANTHVILDSHDEIPLLSPIYRELSASKEWRILWEGQPATIGGMKIISSVLSDISRHRDLKLDFVTDVRYFQLLNRYFPRKTESILKRDIGELRALVEIIPWTSENLVSHVKKSSAAVIPIDLSVPMQRLKPENRLLIMWRLGLPCLTSPSPAYIRVAEKAGVDAICHSTEEWFEKLNQLLDDPGFAHRQIVNGQSYLSDNHNSKVLLNKWDLAMESVMNN